jgi:hypothetical protein
MKVFAFDPAAYREQFLAQEWIHIKNGIDPEFLEVLQRYARERLEATRLQGFGIKGKKEQSLFEFPAGVDYPGELFDVVAELCGLDRAGMTLSERHIQDYDEDADPNPLPHKDRFASQISLGFSIDIPAESKLVLYPFEHREVNPFNSSLALRASLRPDQLPEEVVRTAREIVLDDEPGDVVAFYGSTTWHLRRAAAGAVNLYCKFNDFGCDPLGEDPTTEERRSRTLDALENGNGSVRELVPVLSRRFDLVTKHYTRDWQEVLQASVWGGESLGITSEQYRLLQTIDGTRALRELGEGAEADVRFLAQHGVLDLV